MNYPPGRPKKGEVRPPKPAKKGREGPRPHVWRSGPDEIRHKQYHAWQVAKAQASFREEEFTLTFEQYEEIWEGHWHNRGRYSENECMTRIDHEGAWEWGNVEIISRAEHMRRQGEARLNMNVGYFKRKV